MGNKIKRAIGISESSISVFPVPVSTTRAPLSTDTNYPLGQLWVRTDTAQAWTLCKLSSGAATWALASPGASDVDTINSLSPTGGNMLIEGGTNLTDSNAVSTITLNMDAAITLATSVTAPLFTSAAAMAVTVAAGSDITVKMGDAAAANKISYTDTADAEQASLDSNGVFTANNLVGILGATGAAAITGTTITGTTSVTSDGNLIMSAVATQLVMNGGAVTDFIGQATLTAGTVTVANTNIAAGDRVFVTRSDLNGSTAIGLFDVSITALTNFIIDARKPADATVETNDVSIVDYFIVRQT